MTIWRNRCDIANIVGRFTACNVSNHSKYVPWQYPSSPSPNTKELQKAALCPRICWSVLRSDMLPSTAAVIVTFELHFLFLSWFHRRFYPCTWAVGHRTVMRLELLESWFSNPIPRMQKSWWCLSCVALGGWMGLAIFCRCFPFHAIQPKAQLWAKSQQSWTGRINQDITVHLPSIFFNGFWHRQLKQRQLSGNWGLCWHQLILFVGE